MADLDDFKIFEHLHSAGVPLRASARFGDGVAAALWERDEHVFQRYETPDHHTLSLYVDGGTGIRRLAGERLRIGDHAGPGSLCVMPAEVTSDWSVDGPVRLFHFYIPRVVFNRAVLETLDLDPARVSLRDESFLRDPVLEGMIRSAMLALSWNDPAERVALTHAGRALIAYMAARLTDRGARALPAMGGLTPRVVARLRAFIEANLERALSIDDLAAVADLSPFHFARAFKATLGEPPHAYVQSRRIERAKTLLRADRLPLAEIALLCGFASQSHFTARFRQATGQTPGRYAREREDP
ncbi:AraC family transcriptional regulator [Rhodospirillum rubrum]|uniref:helix-turn-helix domain-containing protein n=1 Tax=Rhodospirillum rubrum TaxID=1085 RepID=UPI001904334D|nr:AraC family transcriptional regulator [Rhodospirillum rubrum]MBK1665451.1 AraC family transcriptional regulator [Rhodospirillum rubrum]MBK1677354.1 AraC family transcriptional regulator [Rhodospirillum rubrum]